MSPAILARDLGLAHIDGALVRMEKPKKAPKPLKRGRFDYRKPKQNKPKTPEQRAIERADRAFSKAVRTLFCGEKGWALCVTCKKPYSYAALDNGHYLGRQYYATRWLLMNCAPQCHDCNRFNEGLKAKFRVALVGTYGEEVIQRMEAMHKTGRKPSLLELEIIIKEIRAGKRTEAPDAV